VPALVAGWRQLTGHVLHARHHSPTAFGGTLAVEAGSLKRDHLVQKI